MPPTQGSPAEAASTQSTVTPSCVPGSTCCPSKAGTSESLGCPSGKVSPNVTPRLLPGNQMTAGQVPLNPNCLPLFIWTQLGCHPR